MKVSTLARRNITRNQRRTLITICATAFAAAIMIVYGTLMDGMIAKMVSSLTDMELGQIQIHEREYRSEPDLYKQILDPEAIITKIENQGMTATPRLYGFALGSTEETSMGVQLRGIDANKEPQVTSLHKALKKGQWLDRDRPSEVIIGKILAKNLAIDIGGEMVLFGQAADGSLASDIVRVRGILGGVSSAVDRAGVYMTLEKFREFFLTGPGVHELAIVIDQPELPLPQALAKVQAAASKQEVLSWRELRPMFAEMMEMSGASMAFMIVLIYIALGLLIINSTFMSIFERTRELGILRAIGMLPRQIVFLILWEALWQMLVAAVLALVLALPSVYYLSRYGIDLRFFMDNLAVAGISLEPVWYAKLSGTAFIMPIAFLLVIVLVASLYPAIKAARVNPVEAIYDR